MILIVTQTFAPVQGGMEAYMTALAAELAKTGRNILVLADGKNGAFSPQGYAVKRFGGWRPLRRFNKRRTIAKLSEIEGIFCDSWKSVESLPKNLTAPVAVLAHGSEFPPNPSPSKAARIKSALSRAQAIIANSHFTANAARAFLTDPNDPRLTIIYPPLPPLSEPTPEAQNEIRRIIGARKPVLSVVARFEPRKGMDSIIAALPNLLPHFPSLLFVVAGLGADEPRLKALAQEKGVADHVAFIGPVQGARKAALLANTDLFVMPVRRVGNSVEGFGISYAEAAYFGVPSLGGKGSGAEDAILDNQTGLLCDGTDQADIESKLSQLLQDEPLRHVLGEAAQKRAKAEFSWARALPLFLKALGIKQ